MKTFYAFILLTAILKGSAAAFSCNDAAAICIDGVTGKTFGMPIVVNCHMLKINHCIPYGSLYDPCHSPSDARSPYKICKKVAKAYNYTIKERDITLLYTKYCYGDG